ncbi:MAG: DUF2183 domain-containing protein [Planctomycetaceae bacterium]|nr:DUF2183 domain-containing protein [Planctomycetaceae bacterium]
MVHNAGRIHFLTHVITVKLFLFPTFAAPDSEHERAWRVRVSGVCLREKTRLIQRKVLENVLKRLTDVDDEELESELCHRRSEPFFMAPLRKRKIRFEVDKRAIATIKKTKRNGQFRAKLLVKETELAENFAETGLLDLSARDRESSILKGALKVRMVPARGHSVISDIDDTIKFSNVENRAELLANTFTRPFLPIAGMPAVYRELAAVGTEFHYVTASPWQLFEPLHAFLGEQDYPPGSMHFRTFRISDHLLKRVGVIHRGGKAAAVRRILASFPERKFTLIGDSGEKDIEIYSRCYQQFPDRVGQILIRLIRPEHRFRESVIEGQLLLPPDVFKVFETPEELAEIMNVPWNPGVIPSS